MFLIIKLRLILKKWNEKISRFKRSQIIVKWNEKARRKHVMKWTTSLMDITIKSHTYTEMYVDLRANVYMIDLFY